jgi:acyl carrier protein
MIEKLKHLIADVKEEPALAASLTPKSRILDEVNLNSLQIVIFLMKLEDEFEIELNYEKFDMKHLADLSALSSFLESQKQPEVQTC